MKILVRKTDMCYVFRAEGAGHHVADFYMLNKEFEAVLAEGGGTFNDCGEVLMARGEQIVFIENAAHQVDAEGTLRYLRVPMDTAKFFKRVKDLADRGIVTESFKEFDPESFAPKWEPAPELSFSDILKHGLFRARATLFEAARAVPKEQLLVLRREISRLLRQGKAIVPDPAALSFYFYPESGSGYNGGIIWHGYSKSYSVHT